MSLKHIQRQVKMQQADRRFDDTAVSIFPER